MGKYRYGVILDGGSSGTRVHVYRWLKSAKAREKADDEELKQLPVLKSKSKWTLKTRPGISTYGDKVDSVGPAYLKELLDFAKDVVPKDEVEDTPLFFMATAGMRLMDQAPRKALLAEICQYIRGNTDFNMDKCSSYVQVISGETEALYGWVAANYLVGGFDNPKEHDHGKGHHTYGFLEMGGASAQIAFAPNSTEIEEHSNDLKIVRLRTVNGEQMEHLVFVTTFLGYGIDEARRKFIKQLIEPAATDSPVEDPCLPSGLKVTTEGKLLKPGSQEEDGSTQYLVGNGDFAKCLTSTYPLLDKEATCDDPPCLFHGVHVPAIDFDVNHFIGVSNFWHGVHDVFNMGHDDAAYDFHTYQTRVNQFCSKDWETIQKGVEDDKWGKKFDEDDAVEICFKASWLINMLHEGIGIPRVPIEGQTDASGKNGTKEVLDSLSKEDGYLQPFQAVDKIHDKDVDWTLGKMVLYAASQIPPADATVKDVGFGKNVDGQAQDFEHAGAAADEPVVQGDDLGGAFYNYGAAGYDYTSAADYADDYGGLDLHRFFKAENFRRTPGFILFFVILVIVGILLCGRERRKNFKRKVVGLIGGDPSRGGAIQLGKKQSVRFNFGLGSRREPKYDRVMEEGDMPNPQDFELHNISSSEDGEDSQDSKASASSTSNSGDRSLRRKAGSAAPRKAAALSPRPNSSASFEPPTSNTGDRGSTLPSGPGNRSDSPSHWRTPVGSSAFKASLD